MYSTTNHVGLELSTSIRVKALNLALLVLNGLTRNTAAHGSKLTKILDVNCGSFRYLVDVFSVLSTKAIKLKPH